MKTQILSVLLVACMAALAPVGAANAKAMECSVARPSNATGYWSWRLIDGRKCWYAGKTMISKSLLKWPSTASEEETAAAKPGPVTVERMTPVNEQGRNLLDARARLLDYTN